jgi:hypothetical protein
MIKVWRLKNIDTTWGYRGSYTGPKEEPKNEPTDNGFSLPKGQLEVPSLQKQE